jgi:hypothetical protein
VTLCGCGCGRVVERRHAVFASRGCANRSSGLARKERNREGARPIAWACGGGVDSTAIAVLICQGELPPPDYAWIVDVGYEPQTTWDYVKGVLQPKLAERGVTLHVLKTTDYTDNDLLRGGFVKIPAYRKSVSGEIQKMHTHCSAGWKARVAERWLRRQGVKSVEQWIGISADETRRVRSDRRSWVRLRYPLVERGLTREDCLYLIGSVGWPRPERSSCWLCPHRSTGDWRRLAARNPDDFQRAVEVERTIQLNHPDVFLHRSAVPLNVAINGCRQAGEANAPSGCKEGLFSCS